MGWLCFSQSFILIFHNKNIKVVYSSLWQNITFYDQLYCTVEMHKCTLSSIIIFIIFWLEWSRFDICFPYLYEVWSLEGMACQYSRKRFCVRYMEELLSSINCSFYLIMHVRETVAIYTDFVLQSFFLLCPETRCFFFYNFPLLETKMSDEVLNPIIFRLIREFKLSSRVEVNKRLFTR